MASILILGGGFGGLIAAEKLAAAIGEGHQVTLVSQSRKFTFYPALVQVAFGQLEPERITFDLQPKLASCAVRFVVGEVQGIDTGSRIVRVSGGDFDGEIHYDYLIVALGRRLAPEKTPGFAEHAHHLLSTTDALKFREAVNQFTEGNIVVGICPGAHLPVPVCETAFALARKFENEIGDKKVSVNVVFPETVDSAFGGAKLSSELRWAFEKNDISLVTNFPVMEITDGKLSSDNWSLNYDLLMLVPPFEGQKVISRLGESSNSLGFAKVNRFMQVRNLERVYAVGDITAQTGPKLAQMAVQQARVAAANIISEINGEKPDAEYYYEIATIIDQGDADSIYLHYGIWDETLYRLQSGMLWGWIKEIHDRSWQMIHS